MSAKARAPGFVIAAAGLRAEARIAERSGHVVAVAGGSDQVRLAALLRKEIARGGNAVISFGICAGLAPGSRAGTCLIGREVVHGDARYPTDRAWATRISSAIGALGLVTIAGVDRPLTGASEKQALHAATGATGADMESHIAARIAREHRLPFAVLRVIADPAERNLPPAALVGMRPDGGLNLAAVLGSLLRSPAQLPALLRVAADTRAAMAALLRCRDLLGPGLGFGDLG